MYYNYVAYHKYKIYRYCTFMYIYNIILSLSSSSLTSRPPPSDYAFFFPTHLIIFTYVSVYSTQKYSMYIILYFIIIMKVPVCACFCTFFFLHTVFATAVNRLRRDNNNVLQRRRWWVTLCHMAIIIIFIYHNGYHYIPPHQNPTHAYHSYTV